jgi:RNA polymerase sigma-70 factor (sigma-E family)
MCVYIHVEAEHLSTEVPDEQTTLAEVYLRSAPGGIRLAYLLTGDRQLAEDLVQDAFVRFVARFRYLRDPGACDAYLRRTVVNLAKNHTRRAVLERAHLRRIASEPPRIQTGSDIESYEAMRSGLLALSERQRAAIVLRYYEDLPEADIADILRCRPATVRSLISRGLQALRAEAEVTG